MHVHPALAHAQRRFQRFDDARALGAADAQPVLHDFEAAPSSCAMDARVALLLEQLLALRSR